jgi:predicted P-loop ATPase
VLQVLSNEKDYRKSLKMIEELGFTLENDVTQTNRNSQKISADEIADYLYTKEVRYDTFIQDLTMCGKVITENQYNTLSIDLKKHFNSEIPRSKFEEVIKSNYVKTHDPILDFVEEHKNCFSVGNFEQWVDCLELKNKDVKISTVVHFFKKWYVGMIAQAMGGEYPNEFFLSLLSVKQGIGKTTLLRKFVLPVQLQKYVLEHALSFDDDFKVIMGQGILIIDDEMDGRTYEAERSFKSLLSTKELTTRRKYDRRISNIKRRASFAGSGNNKFVVKETKNRRILPIEIEQIDYRKLDELKLDELFMEAYNLFNNGFKYSYENSDMPLLEELYMDYRQISELDLIFEEEIKAPEDENDILYISCLDLVLVLSEKYGKSSKMINSKSIGNQMVEMKIDRTRKGAKKTTCYSISKKSSVIKLLNTYSISYSLNPCLFHKMQIPDEVF